MANIMLGYNNLADTGTLSGGSWNSTYPLTNLQNKLLSKAARSTNATAANSQFDINLGSAKSVQAIGVINTNLTSASTYRIRGSTVSNFASTVYDSGTLSAATLTPNLIIGIDTAQTAQYWRIELIDTGNSAGYISAGRLFIGPAFLPTINKSFGASFGIESDTRSVRSVGGVEYFDVRPNRRVYQFGLNWLTDAETYGYLISIAESMDVSAEILLVQDLADTTYRQIKNFLGRMRTLPTMSNPYALVNQASFEIQEVI